MPNHPKLSSAKPHQAMPYCVEPYPTVPSRAAACQAELSHVDPNRAQLCQAVPNCAHLCCAMLNHAEPDCTEPRSTKLCQDMLKGAVPNHTKLYHDFTLATVSHNELCCAELCQAVPSCAVPC